MAEIYSAGSAASRLFVYASSECRVQDYQVITDTDATWAQLLGNPVHVTVEGETPEARKRDADAKKRAHSRAIFGAIYKPTATRRTKNEVEATTALVLDVDYFRETRPPYTAAELQEIFAGFRVIAWTSFSSTRESRKWRVVIPLAVPCPPEKHVPLFRRVVQDVLESTVSMALRDPGRLGYFNAVNAAGAEDYQWFTTQGEYLDWRALDLPDEAIQTLDTQKPVDLTPRPGWTSRDEALKEARRRFASVGRGIGPGERHETLFVAACQLFWDWAADEAMVLEILRLVNSNFVEAKDESVLVYEIQRAHDRVLGENRVAQHVPYGAEREPEVRVSKAALVEHARALKATRKEKQRAIGRVLDRMIEGATLTDDPAEGTDLAYQVLDDLARVFSREAPERIIAVLTQSLSAQRARSTQFPFPDDAVLATRIRQVQQQVVTREEQVADDEQNAHQLAIRTAFGTDRDWPYTDKELVGLAPNQWVVQHGGTYFFWVAGQYVGPLEAPAARAAMPTLLAPAEERVPLAVRTKEGVRRRTLEEIVADHGQVVQHVVRSMAMDRPEILPRALRIPCAVPRPLEPRFDPRIDQWLQLLAGGKYPLLQTWLARLTQLDRALACLCLVAPKNSGKNMLAAGLGRLWRKSQASSSLDAYLRGLVHLDDSPILFCDERIPDFWRRDFAAKFRGFLSQAEHTVNRKGVPVYTVQGFARLLMAGNDLSLLVTGRGDESMSPAAVAALQDRALLICTGDTRAADYLQSLGETTTAEFVEGDLLAQHALWIRDNYDPGPDSRFGVTDTDNDFSVYASVLHEGPNAVLDWVHAHVSNHGTGMPVLVYEGKLCVHTSSMRQQWSLYGQRWEPTLRQLGLAVASVSCDRLKLGFEATVANYRVLDLEKLDKWLSAQGHSVEDFAEDVARLEEWCRKKGVKKR